MPVTRISVDVVMERVPLANRWVSEKWQPAAVLAPLPRSEGPPRAPQCVHDGPEGSQWCFFDCSIELHPSEGEGYYLNLSAAEPSVFVMWRMVEGDAPPARPFVVTLSYNEAARMMDGGEQVDAVAMPGPLAELLAPYVATHYRPEPKKKARRNDPFASDAAGRPALPRDRTSR